MTEEAAEEGGGKSTCVTLMRFRYPKTVFKNRSGAFAMLYTAEEIVIMPIISFIFGCWRFGMYSEVINHDQEIK